jgi:mandelamide amidase
MKLITKCIILSFFVASQISLIGCAAKYAKLPESNLTNSIQSPGSVEAAVRKAIQKTSENKGLNAFIYIDEDEVIKLAVESDTRRKNGELKGPLDGVLLAVKDNIHVAGMPNTAGTPALKSFIPKRDAPVIERLKSAGAIILGKTNMHELAFGISSYNTAFYEGHVGVRNSHNIERMAGRASFTGGLEPTPAGRCVYPRP